MFGRKLEVNVVKDSKKAATAEESQNVEQAIAYSVVVANTVESVGRTILTGVLVIIAAQTAREVIVKSTKER